LPEHLEDLDRRTHLRASAGCNLTLSPSSMPSLQVTPMNLSASGVYCVSSRSLGELTRVDLKLRLFSGEEIPARAVVIREEELSDGSYGLGLFFTRITEEGRETIMDYTRPQEMES